MRFFKIFVSFILLAIIYSSTDWDHLIANLQSLSSLGLISMFCLYILGQVISATKWWLILRVGGLSRSWNTVVRAYFFGMFVNVFGFGTLGGDLARSLAISPERGKKAVALSSVVADRIHGLIIIAGIGFISLLYFDPTKLAPKLPLLLSCSGLCMIGGTFIWFLGPKILNKILTSQVGVLSKLPHNITSHLTSNLWSTLASFTCQPSVLVKITLLSFAFHNTQLWIHWIMARELHSSLSLGLIYATVPFVNIACSLPISIMGLGVRETVYSLLLFPLGVPTETSLAFGAIWVFITTIASGLGAIALSTEKRESINQQI